MMSIAQPLSAFIFAFLGFCFGVCFDLYRVLRRLSTPGQVLTATTDLLFWFTYTVWVYIVLLKVNAGEVRGFLLFSLASGAAGYFLWLSRSLMQAWYFVLCRLISLLTWLNALVTNLLDTVLRMILWPCRMLYTYLFLPLYNLVRWLLMPLIRLLNCLKNGAQAIVQRLLARPKAILQGISEAIARFWGFPPADE